MKTSLNLKARKHNSKAKLLIKKGDSESLRYACLELRYAIEFLSYDKMKGYLDQLPYDIVKVWQPGKVIKTLSVIDSHIENNCTLRVYRENEKGNPEKLVMEGNHESFTAKWATKAHSSLGSFLHAPTLDKLYEDSNRDEKIKKKLTEIICEIERILSGSIHNLIMQNYTQSACLNECGATIKRSIDSLPANGEVMCPNPDCKAVHLIKELPEKKFHWSLKTTKWICNECKTEHVMEFHNPSLPEEWNCPTCNTVWILYETLGLVKKEDWEAAKA